MTPNDVNQYVAESFPSGFESGMRCEELGEGWAIARWTYDDTQLRPGGYIPGPVIFGLADMALWFAVFTSIGLEGMAVTSDLTIHFLRPAIGADLLARAELTKAGRSIAHGSIELWVDGQPERYVAFASGSYSIPST